ncbi:MAG: DNA cytosine methyltransferase [Saprospiraceae bacterium]
MKIVDLFSGCGGLSLGFQNAGFEIAAAFDYWMPAVKVYRANFDHPIFETDLAAMSSYSPIEIFAPEMIVGGPPCQDFSSAGKRDEDQGRGDLTLTFANIISSVKPEWFVMENVERILKTRKLEEAKSLFKSAGYGLSWQVLDASYCGVPQARKRFFMVGHQYSEDGFLDFYFDKNQQKKAMTVADYLGDSLGIEFYYRHPRSYARRGIFSIHEPSPTIRGVNRPIPKNYPQHAGDPCDITPELRPLTTLERSYIQTFPKNFKFLGTKTEMEQIIGNAVPVNLAYFVANCIQEYIADKKQGNAKISSRKVQLAFEF